MVGCSHNAAYALAGPSLSPNGPARALPLSGPPDVATSLGLDAEKDPDSDRSRTVTAELAAS
jgi:hypothetical protein